MLDLRLEHRIKLSISVLRERSPIGGVVFWPLVNPNNSCIRLLVEDIACQGAEQMVSYCSQVSRTYRPSEVSTYFRGLLKGLTEMLKLSVIREIHVFLSGVAESENDLLNILSSITEWD